MDSVAAGFGQRIRFLRRLRGESQVQFNSAIPDGVIGAVVRLELGNAESIRISMLMLLVDMATEMGLTLEWFFNGGPLTMLLSPGRYEAMQGVDVPPGVQLIVEESLEETEQTQHGSAVTQAAATESNGNDAMDGIDSHQGDRGE